VIRKLLDSFSANIAYKAVRNIEYHNIDGHISSDYSGAKLDSYVLSRCTGLQKLTIGFSIHELMDLSRSKPLTRAEIWESKNVNAIFGCNLDLREIKLEVMHGGFIRWDDYLKF
jgi:hypothetical protein